MVPVLPPTLECCGFANHVPSRSWEHKELNNLVEALGADDVDNYPDDRYDLIWTVPYDWTEITAETSEDCAGLDD